MQSTDNQRDSGRRKMHYSPNLLSCVNNALDNKVLLTIEYDSRENELTTRKLEPMALVYKNRKRNLVAWCQLREDWRSFRLDRIDMVKLHKESFEPRAGFNAADFEGDDDDDASDEQGDED
jgi:predicted DNA-binding transcriptional regulator YafY